ncbi:hypothetical protein VNI00_004387, partial [Paramarasmius palmivorus]
IRSLRVLARSDAPEELPVRISEESEDEGFYQPDDLSRAMLDIQIPSEGQSNVDTKSSQPQPQESIRTEVVAEKPSVTTLPAIVTVDSTNEPATTDVRAPKKKKNK